MPAKPCQQLILRGPPSVSSYQEAFGNATFDILGNPVDRVGSCVDCGADGGRGGESRGTVKTSPTASTRLYVRTVPAGAKIEIDGKPSGTSDRLFKVPPGVKKMTVKVELDGHYPKQQEVEIRGGRITRVILELEPTSDAAETRSSSSSPPWAKPGEPIAIPRGSVILGHVGEQSADKRSMGGSGHAVRFERPEGAKYVCAVQIYGSRYGLPEPPKEDFHV